MNEAEAVAVATCSSLCLEHRIETRRVHEGQFLHVEDDPSGRPILGGPDRSSELIGRCEIEFARNCNGRRVLVATGPDCEHARWIVR